MTPSARATPRRSPMRWIVSTALSFRFLVVAAAAAMMIVGVGQLRDMRVDVFPEFAPPQVEVQTESLGLTTSDVESLVTVPLEQALSGIPDLDDMRSSSVPQLSDILLIFKSGTDLLNARQVVQERLSNVQATLPSWASKPSMLPPVSATGRVMHIGMWSTGDKSLEDLSVTAWWTVRARLLQVKGVSNVAVWGERQPQLQVQMDPAKMARLGVSADDVRTSTADAIDSGVLQFTNGSVVGSGGVIDTPNQRINVEHPLAITTPADLARMPLEESSKYTIGDVATVVVDHQPIIGDSVVDGRLGLMLVVEKLPWANTLQLTADVESALKSLQPGLPGIQFDSQIFRPATFIDDSITNLATALLLGFLLVVVILVMFLFEWRVALISLITIPLSLMAAAMVLRASGATVNTMTLSGLLIGLGAVVDDAIIDVENILRRLREHRSAGGTRSTASIILEASLEVRSPIIYATLIIVAAAVPVFLLTGLTAAFFRPLALAYTLAILASMGVALTVTPALTLIMLRNASLHDHASPLVRVLQRGYTALLQRIVNRPRWVYAIFTVVLLAGAAVIPMLGQSFVPDIQQRDVLVIWDTMPGTSSAEMERVTFQAYHQLIAIPGVQSFGSHIGRARQGEEIVGINAGENWLRISPDVNYQRTIDRIRAVILQHPGLFRDVLTYLNERIEEVITGSKDAIDIRVYGQDLTVIKSKAEEILDKVSTVDGVVGQHVALQEMEPQIQVEVNLAKAARYGLSPGDVRREAATLVAGDEVGDIFRGGIVTGVTVWSVPNVRTSVTAIEQLPIDTPNAGQIHLSDVASVSVQPNPNVIQRAEGSRYIEVGANVSGRDLGSVVHDIQAKLGSVSFDRGYHYELLGEYRERQGAESSLLTNAVVALVAILLLLRIAFQFWRPAVFTLLTLPMALIGGAIAIYLIGGDVSIGALVGFFTVFGIAARNGILLINHCQHLESHEGEVFGAQLVLRGARERLSPILMTSLATGLALVPMIARGNAPGQEIEYPLAVVILGGLATSTLLTLFVVPSLYLRWGRSVTRDRSRNDQPAGQAVAATTR
jgi:CzcA family heavy metal efflux pump